MKRIRTGLCPAGRLQAGVAILAAAVTNVTLVQRRLRIFTKAQRAYEQVCGVVESGGGAAAGASSHCGRVRRQAGCGGGGNGVGVGGRTGTAPQSVCILRFGRARGG